jgi:GntR family transcriptional regulator
MEQLFKNWTIEFNSGIPVYRQIMNYISAAVAQGTLQEGEQLPTIRSLHEALNVNANTVAKAYRDLELKGIISSQRGSGCFVAPPQESEKLSAKEKKARIRQLVVRITAEARSHGIRVEELIEHMQQGKLHA